jgi:hypothetical protein
MPDKILPIPIREGAHWEVLIRPSVHKKQRIPTLKECWKLVETNAVRFRGWDYPYVNSRLERRLNGPDWIASWTDFSSQKEYWRLYQSGQFIHYFSVMESLEGMRDEIRRTAKSHLSFNNFDVDAIPGFIHLRNFLYTITEIFEFAARLTQAAGFDSPVRIQITLHNVEGFVLTTDWGRAWFNVYRSGLNDLEYVVTTPPALLISGVEDESLKAALWFFERFGWHNPSIDLLRADQSTFLERNTRRV